MRNGQKIYHCHRTSEAGADIIEYSAPKTYTLKFGYMTVQPTKGSTTSPNNYTTQDFGENILKGWTIFANGDKFKNLIAEGDLLYLDGIVPDSNKPYGYGANGIVTSVRLQNYKIMYVVSKLEGV